MSNPIPSRAIRTPRPIAEKRTTEFRQEQIAAAALDLIAKDGLKGLSMAALAEKVDMVPSALYRHYRGKQQIVGIILGRVRDGLRANLQSARETSPEPCARLRLLLDRHLALLRRSPGLPRLVFSDDLGVRFPGERTKLLGILVEYGSGIEAIVREGQANGCVRADLPAGAFARLFMGMVQSAALTWHLSGGRLEPEAGAEEAWRAFEKALKPE